MQKLDRIRFFEALFIGIATAIYLTRRFVDEQKIAQELSQIDPETIMGYGGQDWAPYNHWLNSLLPLTAGAILLLGAWYVFHYHAFPRIQAWLGDEKTIILTLLTILLAAASSFVYLYFNWELSLFYEDNQLTGANTSWQYRQKNVASLTVVLLTLIGYYECLAQLYYYIHLRLSDDHKHRPVYLSYFLLVCLASVILGFALVGEVPDTFFDLPMQHLGNGLFRQLFYLLSVAVTVYLLQKFCYSYVLPALRRSQWNLLGQRIGIYLVSCAAASWAIYTLAHDFTFPQWPSQFLGVFVAVTLPPAVISYLRQTFAKEKQVLQTQITQTSAELRALRMQINPHFLFNALNTLYAAALRENAEKTSDGIQKLGDMMRFMLHENHQDRIPLSKETEYLYNYIDIQRMRIDESHPIEIRVNIQEPSQEIYIAPMLLNPFVENAFKHGISFRQPSWIYITLTMDDTHLYFKVHNSLHPKPEHNPEENKPGIGLDNVRKRLELLYPDRHTLSIQQSGQDYFASLVLQLE
jgi:hypothetical protein